MKDTVQLLQSINQYFNRYFIFQSYLFEHNYYIWK